MSSLSQVGMLVNCSYYGNSGVDPPVDGLDLSSLLLGGSSDLDRLVLLLSYYLVLLLSIYLVLLLY